MAFNKLPICTCQNNSELYQLIAKKIARIASADSPRFAKLASNMYAENRSDRIERSLLKSFSIFMQSLPYITQYASQKKLMNMFVLFPRGCLGCVQWCPIKVRDFHRCESCPSCPHPPSTYDERKEGSSHFDETLSI